MAEGNAEQKTPAMVENRAAKPLGDSAEEHASHGHRWNCGSDGGCNRFLWLRCSQDHNEAHVAIKYCRRSQSVADCRISATAGRAGAQAGSRTSAISPEQATIRGHDRDRARSEFHGPRQPLQTKTASRTTASGGLTYHFSHRTLPLVIAKTISPPLLKTPLRTRAPERSPSSRLPRSKRLTECSFRLAFRLANPRGATRAQEAETERSNSDEHGEPRTGQRNARDRFADLNQSEGKQYRVFEGTVLEAVLTNRLNGSFAGPVNCMATSNVYSHDGQQLLIPQGSRILGEAKRVTSFGQERLAVLFHRVTMPDGYSVSLDQFKGLNQVGETGLRDQVNHHYAQIFGASLAIGAIAGLAEADTRASAFQSSTDAYRQGVASSLSQSSLRILDRYLNVLPTVTIREGHRVKVYLSDDLLLPAYQNHRMPGDL